MKIISIILWFMLKNKKKIEYEIYFVFFYNLIFYVVGDREVS